MYLKAATKELSNLHEQDLKKPKVALKSNTEALVSNNIPW